MTDYETFVRVYGEPRTPTQKRLLEAFIEGCKNSKPRAARQSAMAGARRRRFKRTKKEES